MDSPVPATLLTSTGITETYWILDFYLVVGDPSLGPHACVVGILSVDPSSQSGKISENPH